MMKKFFHGLNSLNISYLLISGQATVLYGASSFSEDVDIWIKPNIDNWNNFLKLLNNINAKMHKLTPVISMENINKGHGFHFKIPSDDNKPPHWYLDVMGIPPRVNNFEECHKNSTSQKTDWGKIDVIGIKDLVEIKKTRRLEDYPIISKLVKIEYKHLSSKEITPKDLEWILTNSFEIEDIIEYLNDKAAVLAGKSLNRPCLIHAIKALTVPSQKEHYIEAASKDIALEIESYRQKDRKYWESIIKELKTMKGNNQLIPLESTPPQSIE